MSYERTAHEAVRALTHMAHAFTRLATAQQRIADAMEEANHIAAQTLPVLPSESDDSDWIKVETPVQFRSCECGETQIVRPDHA